MSPECTCTVLNSQLCPADSLYSKAIMGSASLSEQTTRRYFAVCQGSSTTRPRREPRPGASVSALAGAAQGIQGEGEQGLGARRRGRTHSISLPLKQAGHLRELACTSGSSTALLVARLLLIAGQVCTCTSVCVCVCENVWGPLCGNEISYS